jgi:hypothetical protein
MPILRLLHDKQRAGMSVEAANMSLRHAFDAGEVASLPDSGESDARINVT